MAASMAQAREMVAAADRAGRLFMVSQNRRYKPGLAAFRETVSRLGTLSSLTCDFYRAHRDAAAEFLFSFPQPLLLDMAIHLFDGARAISGADPVSVYCEAFDPPGTWYDGPAAANAVFRMTGDVALRLQRQLGGLRVPDVLDGLVARGRGVRQRDVGRRRRPPPRSPARGKRLRAVPLAYPDVEREGRFNQLEDSLADFVAALRTGSVPLGECHDNLRSLAMCHAAVESATVGAPVPVGV